MTHITEGIQEDSLKVLDILLEQYPALITGRSSILLKNFVELISHQQLSKGLVNRDRSQSWILSVNPNRRLTSQQWRLKVLVRLSKFLQALADGSSRLRESEGLQEQKKIPMPLATPFLSTGRNMPTTSNTSRFMNMGVHSQMSVHSSGYGTWLED